MTGVQTCALPIYHGPDGLRAVAAQVHQRARSLAAAVGSLGLTQLNDAYFDTVRVGGVDAGTVRREAESARINFRYRSDGSVGVALDETTTDADLADIVRAFARAVGRAAPAIVERQDGSAFPDTLARRSTFLTHPVFHAHRSESAMMRYIRALEDRKSTRLNSSHSQQSRMPSSA